MMSDNGSNKPQGDLGAGQREFKLWMMSMSRGLTHAELYTLIAGGYDFYGAMPIRRPVTAKERLNPNIPAGVQAIIEPMLVFIGPVDAPEIVLEIPGSGIVD